MFFAIILCSNLVVFKDSCPQACLECMNKKECEVIELTPHQKIHQELFKEIGTFDNPNNYITKKKKGSNTVYTYYKENVSKYNLYDNRGRKMASLFPLSDQIKPEIIEIHPDRWELIN